MKKLVSIRIDGGRTQDQKTEIYIQDNLWYYQIDKGQEIGPFRYQSEAQSNLNKFLSGLKQRLDADPEQAVLTHRANNRVIIAFLRR